MPEEGIAYAGSRVNAACPGGFPAQPFYGWVSSDENCRKPACINQRTAYPALKALG